MLDLLDILSKEQKSETKLLKVERKLEDYSNVYKKVIFEKRAFCKNNDQDNDKCTFNFQDSFDSLKKRGYKRHARPNEAFGLLCAYLEGDLSVENVAKDMLFDYGEWLSLAMEYQNNLLHCYIDPDIEYDRKCNLYNLKSFYSERFFPISELDEKTYFSIKELHAKNLEFVEFIWSRPFNDLPSQIRESGGMYLYLSELLRPVCGNVYYVTCGINSRYNYAASRGVAPKTESSK